jgi:myo-inositol 2-dehydrogenase/D-chiro-inositol 1-dehydrogenase
MTIHDFDMARFMLGEEPDTVMASASVLVDKAIGKAGDFDTASVILRTPSGKQCLISNSRRATYGYDQRVEVLGSRGSVAVENQRPVGIEIASADGFVRPPLHNFFMTRYVDAYALEIAAFVSALGKKSEPSPSGLDGLLALKLADAAEMSARENRAVKIK